MKLKITIVRSIGLCIALAIGTASFAAASELGYDALIQQGKSQLQAGSAEPALAVGQSAIKIDKDRWEGYALAGGAQMNLKRYEAAADTLTEAIKRAPESKQAALRELRRQCLTAETSPPGAAAIPSAPIQAPTTQAEIVMWKSIEHSGNPADFQTYLEQYPQGAFVALARRHMEDAKASPVAPIQPAAPPQPAATTPTPSLTLGAEVGKYIVAANKAVKNNDLDTALSQLKTAQSVKVRTDSEDMAIDMMLANVYARKQDYSNAAPLFEKLASSRYATPEQQKSFSHGAIILYAKDRNWPKVIEAGQEARKYGELDIKILTLIAQAQYADNRFKDAAATMQDVIDRQGTPDESSLALLHQAQSKAAAE